MSSSSFSEEPLDAPVGYFSVEAGQTLNNGQWSIVRKLGWGPRSSSWLAVDMEDPDEYEVLKIFTRAATEEPAIAKELELLQDSLSKVGPGVHIPTLIDHFYEEGSKGRHLCMVIRPLGESIESLRLAGAAESGGSFPVHAVRKFVADLLEPLVTLDKIKIIHGAIMPSNLLLWSVQSGPDIREYLAEADAEVLAPGEKVIGKDGVVYPTSKSQPVNHGFKWNSPREDIANASIYLSNFGHARKAEGTVVLDASPDILPPEALQGPRKITTKANIWQVGCLAYFLLTGVPLFPASYAESPKDVAAETLSKLEELLASSKKLSVNDIPSIASFLRMCLAVDPKDRPTAYDLLGENWVQQGAVCSCGWCAANN